jgi:hypothetical protein
MKVGVLATTVFAFLIGLPIASFAGLAPDADADGIPDVLDKCSTDTRNSVCTTDDDVDGYGNTCDPDFDQGGTVDAVDFGLFFAPKFKSATPVPGPSGLACAGTPGCI